MTSSGRPERRTNVHELSLAAQSLRYSIRLLLLGTYIISNIAYNPGTYPIANWAVRVW